MWGVQNLKENDTEIYPDQIYSRKKKVSYFIPLKNCAKCHHIIHESEGNITSVWVDNQ